MEYSEYRNYLIKAAAVAAFLSMPLDFVLGRDKPQTTMVWIIYVIGILSIIVATTIREYTNGAEELQRYFSTGAKVIAGSTSPLVAGYLLTVSGEHQSLIDLFPEIEKDPSNLFQVLFSWLWVVAIFITPPVIYIVLTLTLSAAWRYINSISDPLKQQTWSETRKRKQDRPLPPVAPNQRVLRERDNNLGQQSQAAPNSEMAFTRAVLASKKLLAAQRMGYTVSAEPVKQSHQEIIQAENPPTHSEPVTQIASWLVEQSHQEIILPDKPLTHSEPEQQIASGLKEELSQPTLVLEPQQEVGQQIIATADHPGSPHQQGARIRREPGIWRDKALPHSEQTAAPYVATDRLALLSEDVLRQIDGMIG